MPGPTVRAVNADLNGWALRRAGLPELDELESKTGDDAADCLEQRLGTHTEVPEKKSGGTPPRHPPLRSRNSAHNLMGERGESTPEGKKLRGRWRGEKAAWVLGLEEARASSWQPEVGHHPPVGPAGGAMAVEEGAVMRGAEL